MSLFKLFGLKKKKVEDDPRIRVTDEISLDDFILINDQTWEYRKKVHPKALTLEFWEENNLMDRILHWGELKSEILDVGCGSGEIDIILAKHGYVVTGVDISPVAIELAQEHRRCHPDLKDLLTFLVHNIEEGPLLKKYSSALFSHTLEHVLSPDKTMRNIIGSLRPGSHIFVSVPLKKAWRDRTHLRHFTARSLKKFLMIYSPEVEVIEDKKGKLLLASVRV